MAFNSPANCSRPLPLVAEELTRGFNQLTPTQRYLSARNGQISARFAVNIVNKTSKLLLELTENDHELNLGQLVYRQYGFCRGAFRSFRKNG